MSVCPTLVTSPTGIPFGYRELSPLALQPAVTSSSRTLTTSFFLHPVEDERLARATSVPDDPGRARPQVDGRYGELLVGEELHACGARRDARDEPDEPFGRDHGVVHADPVVGADRHDDRLRERARGARDDLGGEPAEVAWEARPVAILEKPAQGHVLLERELVLDRPLPEILDLLFAAALRPSAR